MSSAIKPKAHRPKACGKSESKPPCLAIVQTLDGAVSLDGPPTVRAGYVPPPTRARRLRAVVQNRVRSIAPGWSGTCGVDVSVFLTTGKDPWAVAVQAVCSEEHIQYHGLGPADVPFPFPFPFRAAVRCSTEGGGEVRAVACRTGLRSRGISLHSQRAGPIRSQLGLLVGLLTRSPPKPDHHHGLPLAGRGDALPGQGRVRQRPSAGLLLGVRVPRSPPSRGRAVCGQPFQARG